MTIERLQEYLKKTRKNKGLPPGSRAGAKSYMLERQAKISQFRENFPALWSELSGVDFRGKLANLIAGVGTNA